MKEYILKLGEKINHYDCRILENIYYFLCAIVYGE